MYQVIYRISINLYRYEYRIEKTDRYPALPIRSIASSLAFGMEKRPVRQPTNMDIPLKWLLQANILE